MPCLELGRLAAAMYYRGVCADLWIVRAAADHIVTSYSSPMPSGKENRGGDAKAAGFDARETVAVESS